MGVDVTPPPTLKIHHFEFQVKDGQRLLQHFRENFGFELIAVKDHNLFKKWAIQCNHCLFIITQPSTLESSPRDDENCDPDSNILERSSDSRKIDSSKVYQNGSSPVTAPDKSHPTSTIRNSRFDSTVVDTACNAAFEVDNLLQLVEHLQRNKCSFTGPLTEVYFEDGSQLVYTGISSPCGNVCHTLLEQSKGTGKGNGKLNNNETEGRVLDLQMLKTNETNLHYSCNGDSCGKGKASSEKAWPGKPSHFDHLAMVCNPGEFESVMDFYETCFSMVRFPLDAANDGSGGFVIRGNAGLHLKMMTTAKAKRERECYDFCLVFAEPLNEVPNSHVQSFLSNHGGPGLQHIALHTDNIDECVYQLNKRNVQFRRTPPSYYTKEKLSEIAECGDSAEKFRQHGILLDVEKASDGSKRFLLQIFSRPIFEEETFFLEVIQRKGATGFGEGNITALANSIENERLHDQTVE